jgi:hypothetical protein
MDHSKVGSKINASQVAKWIIWLYLILGKRPGPPVNAAEVASQARPCWVAYAAGARVTSLPDRTPWEPRYKAGTGGGEDLDFRQSALSAGASGLRRRRETDRRGRDLSGDRTVAPGQHDHGLVRPTRPDDFGVTAVVFFEGDSC